MYPHSRQLEARTTTCDYCRCHDDEAHLAAPPNSPVKGTRRGSRPMPPSIPTACSMQHQCSLQPAYTWSSTEAVRSCSVADVPATLPGAGGTSCPALHGSLSSSDSAGGAPMHGGCTVQLSSLSSPGATTPHIKAATSNMATSVHAYAYDIQPLHNTAASVHTYTSGSGQVHHMRMAFAPRDTSEAALQWAADMLLREEAEVARLRPLPTRPTLPTRQRTSTAGVSITAKDPRKWDDVWFVAGLGLVLAPLFVIDGVCNAARRALGGRACVGNGEGSTPAVQTGSTAV